MVDHALPDVVRFGRELCGDLAQAERREWWLANLRGAYAGGTLAGSLTRRYHGLLIAPLEPPLGRHLVLAKADATLTDGEGSWPLFTNRWADGTVMPLGHLHLESFHLEGRMPVWTFALGAVRVEQRIWLEPDAPTVRVAWRLRTGSGAARAWQLRVLLLANDRDHHCTARPYGFDPSVAAADERLRVSLPAGHTLEVVCTGGTVWGRKTWYENFRLTAEAARGLDSVDNHLCVGEVTLRLEPERWVGLAASLDPNPEADLEGALARALAHERALLAQAEAADPVMRAAPDWVRQLVLAADSFLLERPLPGLPQGRSVIAGHPWFGDWGRDALIALPGLTLATGQPARARAILDTFARLVDQGMLPNTFPGAGTVAVYTSVDAALWYVEAWRAYVEASDDQEGLAAALPGLEDIARRYLEGTRYGIRVDPADGLLQAGEPGLQLTWMDAKVGDWVVTPRTGKPVEVNALWYNGLCALAGLLARAGASGARDYQALARRTREGFRRFLRADGGGLLDVVDGPNGDDPRVRPNQILAVSLPHSPLDPAAQRAVVADCGRELLTSYGLRSLAPSHPDYRGSYAGGVWERDEAYHQGTAWAWLLGHYALAEHRVTGDPVLALSRLEPIRDHLLDAGLGTVSEIFDGAPPHAPCGAPGQAWSVACVLEAWWRLSRVASGP
jgi:4-alpha-glucanotransferase